MSIDTKLHQQLLPFLRAIVDSPGDMTLRYVFADWLEEHGMWRDEAYGWFFMRPFDCYSFGIGIGIGSGRGSGSGIGSGRGSGRGRGSGSGIGRGIGSGSWSGRGSGYLTEHYMTPGKAYLLHQGDWHTFVGRCVAQTGPFTYLFHYVSQIDDTNDGANWQKLAAGDKAARKKATYRHEQTEQEFPLTIRASVWLGKTPAEEAGVEMLGVEG